MPKLPSKKEFERYELKRPDFRTRFWRNRFKSPIAALYPSVDKVHLQRLPPRTGSGEWWAWVALGIKEDRSMARMVRYFFKRLLDRERNPRPLPLASGKTVKFTRLLSLEKR